MSVGLTEAQNETLEYIRGHRRPFVKTSDIEDAFGISQQAAYNRLRALEELGELEREKMGARAVAWWPSAG